VTGRGREIGLAVVGSGRIGSLRSTIASAHPSVRFLAVSDRDAEAARRLAETVGASVWSADNSDVISHPDVTAVIVATSEGDHVQPVLDALSLDKSVLVEKPIALTLADADVILAATEVSRGELHVGYSRRFRRRYQVAKEQIVQDRMGRVLGGAARVYNSRAQALAMLDRNPQATPVVDALTYYVDLMNWFLEGRRVVDVTAVGQRGVLEAAGYDTSDLTWATLRYDDGAVISLGVCYSLPTKYPSLGHAARVELIGTDGVMLLADDHTDQVMYSDRGVPHVYLPGHDVNAVFLSSGTPGDWALSEFIGPLAAETRSWLDHLVTGRGCVLSTPREARATLEVTLAIERATDLDERVELPPDPHHQT
jgi:predicted dehydrogenase